MFNPGELDMEEELWPYTDRWRCSHLFFQTKLIPFFQGFSEDVFSQFDPVLGNKVCNNKFLFSLSKVSYSGIQVWFANEFVSVVCKTPISSNFLLENPQDPSTTRITCHLPPRMGSQGSNWFNLILKVNTTFFHALPMYAWYVWSNNLISKGWRGWSGKLQEPRVPLARHSSSEVKFTDLL